MRKFYFCCLGLPTFAALFFASTHPQAGMRRCQKCTGGGGEGPPPGFGESGGRENRAGTSTRVLGEYTIRPKLGKYSLNGCSPGEYGN